MTTINNFSYLLLSTSFVVETDCVILSANNLPISFIRQQALILFSKKIYEQTFTFNNVWGTSNLISDTFQHGPGYIISHTDARQRGLIRFKWYQEPSAIGAALMQNHLTRILVNEFIYPAYIHSDTIHFMAEEHTLAMHSSWWARLDLNQRR